MAPIVMIRDVPPVTDEGQGGTPMMGSTPQTMAISWAKAWPTTRKFTPLTSRKPFRSWVRCPMWYSTTPRSREHQDQKTAPKKPPIWQSSAEKSLKVWGFPAVPRPARMNSFIQDDHQRHDDGCRTHIGLDQDQER